MGQSTELLVWIGLLMALLGVVALIVIVLVGIWGSVRPTSPGVRVSDQAATLLSRRTFLIALLSAAAGLLGLRALCSLLASLGRRRWGTALNLLRPSPRASIAPRPQANASCQVKEFRLTVGRTAIEFVANNPGVWLFHCHNLEHMEGGMTMEVHYL